MSEQPKNMLTSNPHMVVLYGAAPADISPRVPDAPYVPTVIGGNWVTCELCGTLRPPVGQCVGCLMKSCAGQPPIPAPVQPVDPRDPIRAHLRAAITAALDAKLYVLANTITMALAELEKTP